jgi:hypothetical protein
MRQDLEALSLKIDSAMKLCKNVLEYGEKIRELSPMDTGMDAYAEELTNYTEDRGRATRVAIQELSAMNKNYEIIENDSTVTSMDRAFLYEKILNVQSLSSQFAKQNEIIRKSIEIHLGSLRKESIEFHHNVGVIKSYLKAPDKRTFYG